MSRQWFCQNSTQKTTQKLTQKSTQKFAQFLNSGKCYFDYKYIKGLTNSGMVCLDKLESASKYKLPQLQEIATALEIPITEKGLKGNAKNITKSTLYQQVSDHLYWLR